MRVVIEDVLDEVKIEDSGQALIATLECNELLLDGEKIQHKDGSGFFLRLQSWSEFETVSEDDDVKNWQHNSKKRESDHAILEGLRGKKIRITIETIK